MIHSRRSDDAGQALVETIMLGLLMLVPLLWALGVLADLHRAALSSAAAAREAGFDASHASSLTEGADEVARAVHRAFADNGLDPRRVRVAWSADRLARGGAVEVRVAYPVTVFQAPLLGDVGGPWIWVRAEHVARIDRFGSRR
jgi:hypothetical protein